MRSGANMWKICAGSVLIWAAFVGGASGQTSDAKLNALIKKGILTEQEAKDALAEVQNQKVETKPSPFVWIMGKETKLNLGGMFQGNGEFGDVASWLGNFSDNPLGAPNHTPSHDGFRIRRARIALFGEYFRRFEFKLEGDFEQADGLSSGRTGFSATDLWVNYGQFPEANLKLGQYKAPFGLEELMGEPILFTAERSLPTVGLVPDRQVGVQLSGKPLTPAGNAYSNLLEYSVGVFNGNGRNISFNDDSHLMYAGRIGSTPFAGTWLQQPVKWRIAADSMYSRYAKGTRVSPSGPLLLNQIDGSLAKFELPGAAESWGWGVDQWLTVGPFDLLAEYLEQNIDPKYNTSFREFVANGYWILGGYFLPGRKFQLVAKWESFNPGQSKDDDIQSVTGGLNYYIKGENLKVMLNFIHSWSEWRNSQPLSGEEQFDMATVRFQVLF